MNFKEFHLELSALLNHFQSLALLFARLLIAYGFLQPALLKWSYFDATSIWFGEVGIPFASLATFAVASFEVVGIVLLALGLFTRYISIPLMVIMMVAIFTVHLDNGFSTANNGFEIPLYYLLFLSFFAVRGAGKFSLDNALFRIRKGKE
ncbi:MAG: Membrane protein, distant similarity to thiosulphate:quinone oxidoreductase DoxD [uncultured Sulfurovum sp.]|uniref:Membrane protein, distant similarity to thiosulphate:quinone oxidoreductase DoxD n=1 Tax=uncultured Sulfurovum sp. TaxID=269237 RepID=A0A6S6TIN2_9BACT|nr:MAG: Membrane protein, distant similarity to thiosulphate:quinone oxidoreductase DoxD [uncultured Sulfurovum sp.]